MTKGFTDNFVQIQRIDYDKFNDNIAIVKTKPLKQGTISFFSGFKIEGQNISNFSSDEKEIAFDNLKEIFKVINYRISIVKISKLYDLKENENFLNEQIIKNNDKKQIKEIFSSYLDSLNYFKSSNYQNNYYIFVYGNSKNDVIENVNDLRSRFEMEKFTTKLLSKSEIVQVQLDIFNHQNKEEIEDSYFEDIIDKNGQKVQKALTYEDILAFDKLKFHSSYIEINDNLKLNIQSISQFPLEINYNWLDLLFNTPSSIVMHIDAITPEEARVQLHKNDMNIKTSKLDNRSNVVDKIDLEKTHEALNELAERVAIGEEKIKQFQLFFVNSAYNDEEFQSKQKINISNANTLNCVINPLHFLQFEAFQNIILKSTDNLKFYQQVPDATLAGGWPFSNNDFNDKNGFIVGSSYDGDVIILDQFKTDNNRTNYNMMILGSSGSGKSTFTKKMVMYNIAEGNQNIIIDPESEYKDLLNQFNGSLYLLGENGKTVFNPLQIQNQLSEKDENEEEFDNFSIIADHINWFGSWIKILFPELNDSYIRFIESQLKMFYEKEFEQIINKIKISNLDSEDYPTISKFIEFIKEENTSDERKIKTIEILEHHFVNGKLKNIYNGCSNVSFDDQLIIFDVQSIFTDENSNYGRAALYLIISKINDQLIKNYRKNDQKRSKINLYIDEAHLLLDKDNPITINFLHRTVKRIRKYNGGVVLTTQNPGDFADSGDSKKLANILNNIQYSFFLKMKSQDVEAVSNLYKSIGGLTEYERKNLVRIPRGHCLFNPSYNIRKFIKFHYNKLEKKISWKNYIDNENDFENEEDVSNNDLQKEVEPIVMLPKPLKAIYLFFWKIRNKRRK